MEGTNAIQPKTITPNKSGSSKDVRFQKVREQKTMLKKCT